MTTREKQADTGCWVLSCNRLLLLWEPEETNEILSACVQMDPVVSKWEALQILLKSENEIDDEKMPNWNISGSKSPREYLEDVVIDIQPLNFEIKDLSSDLSRVSRLSLVRILLMIYAAIV